MESFKEVWELVREYCKTKVSEVAFNTWINEIQPVRLENNEAVVFVRANFQRKIVSSMYSGLIAEAFENTIGFPVNLTIVTGEDGYAPEGGKENNQTAPIQGPDYEYTFNTFIVGSSNNLAYAAAQAVAARPAGIYNPLFIYGNSGLGKTHLLNAICHEIRQKNPNTRILYTRGEDFTNELINFIGSKNTMEFHNKYRNCDVLLVDDIQFIAGKIQTQEEFFHTFNSLYQDGKQIVLTSDRPPKEIQTLEDRLRTRFEWGLLTDIQPPDFETRVAILKRKAQLLDIDIPNDVVEYIAEKLKTNIRQLEGTVKKIKAYSGIGHTPSIILAQNAIRDILSDNQPMPITVEKIILEVSRTFNVTAEDIRSNKRSSNISRARQIAMYVVREITAMPMESIGAEFGGRDHSTVIYALNQVEKLMEKDSKTRAAVNDIIKNIRDK